VPTVDAAADTVADNDDDDDDDEDDADAVFIFATHALQKSLRILKKAGQCSHRERFGVFTHTNCVVGAAAAIIDSIDARSNGTSTIAVQKPCEEISADRGDDASQWPTKDVSSGSSFCNGRW
jgi:hypothetical protein